MDIAAARFLFPASRMTETINMVAFREDYRKHRAVRAMAAAPSKIYPMQKIIGLISLVTGITALWFGHTASQAANSTVSPLVEGAPTDRATYFYIGGIALTVFGMLKLLFGKKK